MSTPPPDPDFVLRGKEDAVHSLCCPGIDNLLLSGTQSGEILSWNLETRRVQHSVTAHPGHSVLWLQDLDGDHLLSAGRDGQLCQFKCSGATWTCLDSLKSGAMGFCNAGFLANKKAVAVSTDDMSEIKLVSLKNGVTMASLKPAEGKKGMCMHINVPISEEELFVAYEDGSISVWDLRTSKESCHLQIHSEAVMGFDYDSVLQKGCSVSVDNVIKLWRYDGNNLQELTNIEVTNSGFNGVLFRPDSKLFVTAGWDGRSRIFSSKKHTPLAVLTYHNQAIQALSFTATYKLCAGSKDGNISLWSVYSG